MANITNPNVVNFKSRIEDIAGSLASIDNDALGQWLLEGCYDVLDKVGGNPEILERFVVSESSTSAVAKNFNTEGYRQIIAAEREGYPCRKIPAWQRKDISDVTSMYYVNEDSDPVWYIHNNVFHIKPTVVNENGGATWYYIPEYTITHWDTGGTSKIDNFPPEYYQHICLYTGIKVWEKKLANMIATSPDSVDIPALPTMPSAPTLPDNVLASLEDLPDVPTFNPPGLSVDMSNIKPSAMYWLEEEEDTELVSSALSIVQKEIDIYREKYSAEKERYDKQKDLWDAEIEHSNKRSELHETYIARELDLFDKNMAIFGQELAIFDKEINKYNQIITSESKKFEQEMEKLKQDYQWTQSQLGLAKANYKELWGPEAPQQGGQ